MTYYVVAAAQRSLQGLLLPQPLLTSESAPFSLQDRASRFASMVAAFCERLGWYDLEALISRFQVPSFLVCLFSRVGLSLWFSFLFTFKEGCAGWAVLAGLCDLWLFAAPKARAM